MYLLSKKQTVLKALVYGVVSIVLITFLVIRITEGSIFGIVFYAALVGIYTSAWRDYVKAFKRRAYDREYAKAKEQLQQTLKELLPADGRVTLNQENRVTLVHRGMMKFLKKEFFIVNSADVEIFYDDLSARNLIISHHSYNVADGILYVSKSFDTTMVNMNDDQGTQAQPVPEKTSLLTYLRESNKANRSIPEDLRYASLQELQDLRNLLLEGREEIVS